MNITIVIPDEIEAALRHKAALLGQDVDEYLQRVIVADVEEELPIPPRRESPDEFMSRLRDMVHRHGVHSGHVDDSRESIYAGRGE